MGLMAVMGRSLRVRPVGWVIAVGVLQTAGNTALSLLALRLGPAGRSALLCYAMPFWVVLLAWPILRERPAPLQWVALPCALAGLGLVFAAGSGTGGNLAAAGLAVGSGLCWALGTVLARRLLVQGQVEVMALAAWQMLAGGLALWLGAALFPGPPTSWSPYLVFAALYEILPATAVAWLLWTALLGRVTAGVASLAILAAPVLGLLASAAEMGERPPPLEALGLSLLVVALVVVGPLALHQARRPASPAVVPPE
jgi:drug/metabolite transporter (DMT)-like permease